MYIYIYLYIYIFIERERGKDFKGDIAETQQSTAAEEAASRRGFTGESASMAHASLGGELLTSRCLRHCFAGAPAGHGQE